MQDASLTWGMDTSA